MDIKMATAFRIHEDIDNAIEQKKERKNVIGKTNANGKDKRTTFAILNNGAFDGRNGAHAQRTALNILAAKKSAIIQQTNDENALPEHYAASAAAAKQEAKIPVDQFKAFAVFEEEQSPADENVPPKKKESSVSDEVDSTTMTNSYTTVRQPLQEIRQDDVSPMCIREILSPMSVDRSLMETDANAAVSSSSALQTTSSRFSIKNELDKFFEVDEYRQDILDYLRDAEERHRPKPLYMRKQPDISPSMRTILVDWLVEVGEEYRLQTETLCLAVSYIDRFLSVMSVVRAKLQLVGTAAMFIAAKYEEIYPPDVGEFVYITDNTYTKTQVLRMEQLILKVLKFDLCVPTTSIFLNAYPMLEDLPKDVKYLAQFFCELSLLEAEPYLQYTPSKISAAAIALARFNFSYPLWSRQLEQITGYNLHDLTEIILYLGESHNSSTDSSQQAIQEKYKTNKYLEVSNRTPATMDELSRAINTYDHSADDSLERNENVRQMISSILFD